MRLASRFRASSERTLSLNLISSAAEFAITTDEEGGFSLGGGGKLDSSSTIGAIGLETADPPPSTPLLTEGVFSESLHSSSSPETVKQHHFYLPFPQLIFPLYRNFLSILFKREERKEAEHVRFSIFDQTKIFLIIVINIILHIRTFPRVIPITVDEFAGNDHGPRKRIRDGGAGRRRRREREREREREKRKTRHARCVSMAVRLPNGRSPRQPLRTLCSLPPLPHLSLSIRLSVPPLQATPLGCTLRTPRIEIPHHSKREPLRRRKGLLLSRRNFG